MSRSQFSSPNAVTWEYFHIVEMSIDRARCQASDRIRRQDIALAIVMALNAIEVFMNVYFRVLVEEDKYSLHKKYLLKCIKDRKDLGYKLREWPRRILDSDLSKESALGQKIYDLKDLRNSIVHFTTTHESIQLEGTSIEIRGLADTSPYFSLELKDGEGALATARDFAKFVFQANGVETSALGTMLHGWCGYAH